MSRFLIEGGKKLNGEIRVSPSKNSTLSIICASILNGGTTFIKNCPDIGDINVLLEIIRSIGGKAERKKAGVLIDAEGINSTRMPEDLTSGIRASFFLVGAMLSRFKEVTLSRPGGCKIGTRPIDIHLDGLRSLGLKIEEGEREIKFSAKELKGGVYRFRYPSVGATQNLIFASVFAKGETVLYNAAREPEIVDLQKFLNLLGGKIKGAGTSVVRIEGVEKLKENIEFLPMPDRIEGGTFLLAALGAGGEVCLKGARAKNISSLIKKIDENACKIRVDNVNIYSDNIYINSTGNPTSFKRTKTGPYPYFPTDLHPLLSAVLTKSKGVSQIEERVFDSRFAYVQELRKLGAKISLKGNVATFFESELYGAEVVAKDLRGGAGLVLAGLFAQGKTAVLGGEHILRGYESIDEKLRGLGASVVLEKS